MSKKYYRTTEPREETIEEVVESVAEAEEATEKITIEAKFKMGKVADCELLNVRKQPSANAEVVCTIGRNTDVEIDDAKSTSNFYKICVASGVEGFCMKRFIKVDS